MSSTLELAGLIVGSNGVTAVLTTVLSGRFNRAVNAAAEKKNEGDASQAFAVAAVTLVKPLEERVSKLEQQQSLAVSYIRDLWAWIDRHIPGRKPPAPPAGLNLT